MKGLSGAGGNWQVIDEISDPNTDKILIRDPWNATRYKMDREEFLNYWNIQAVYSLNR